MTNCGRKSGNILTFTFQQWIKFAFSIPIIPYFGHNCLFSVRYGWNMSTVSVLWGKVYVCIRGALKCWRTSYTEEMHFDIKSILRVDFTIYVLSRITKRNSFGVLTWGKLNIFCLNLVAVGLPFDSWDWGIKAHELMTRLVSTPDETKVNNNMSVFLIMHNSHGQE